MDVKDLKYPVEDYIKVLRYIAKVNGCTGGRGPMRGICNPKCTGFEACRVKAYLRKCNEQAKVKGGS